MLSEPAPDDFSPAALFQHKPCGTVIYGFSTEPELRVDFLIKERTDIIEQSMARPDLQMKIGAIEQDGVIVVVLLFTFNPRLAIYPTYWNYHDPAHSGPDGHLFRHMATAAPIDYYLLSESGDIEWHVRHPHPFQPFFRDLLAQLPHRPPWSNQQFADAVHTLFDGLDNPKELWDSMA